ncbi:ComF family protein [Luteimonas granuli]|uniref:ComF family protein n=1 Tax=Luteimonas granuli TaxID=1176533 RepID=A0A518N4D6_9GAMM|nr:ComF family protein [Luteimonas granuli]QDW66783.1 ComF family protein [Luteimonas granuli]
MSGPVNLAHGPAVDGWLARIGRGLWPPRCLVCGEPAPGPLDLCPACEAELPWMPPACLSCAMPLLARALRSPEPDPWPAVVAGSGADPAPLPRLCSACQHAPPPLSETRAAFLYGFPLDRLLPRLKFHRDLAAGRLLAQAMAASLSGCPRPCALVPVPLHRARMSGRGYNQALELARPLGRLLGVPVRPGLLRRIRHTAPQSRLDADARAGNLRDAFEVPSRVAVPAHVTLVDDVMTTGATLDAAADALLDAGAERVDAWVCARAAR